MVDEIGRRATVGAAIVALGVAGSAVLGGMAIAHGAHVDKVRGGAGGGAQARCVLPLGLSVGLMGDGGERNACRADGGGASGAGY